MSFSKLLKAQFAQTVDKSEDKVEDISFTEYCAKNQIKQLNDSNKIYHPQRIATKKRHIVVADNEYLQSWDAFSDYAAHTQFNRSDQKYLIKALQQGKYKIIASIDLHNNTQARALHLLERFLENHSTVGNSCLKIIHGKGLGSVDGIAVLKNMVRRYLEHNVRVLAYTDGGKKQGGDGVTLVKLRD
jgi:DNA-nicking Smr family endonuclease